MIRSRVIQGWMPICGVNSVLERWPRLGGTLLIPYTWAKCLFRTLNTIRLA